PFVRRGIRSARWCAVGPLPRASGSTAPVHVRRRTAVGAHVCGGVFAASQLGRLATVHLDDSNLERVATSPHIVHRAAPIAGGGVERRGQRTNRAGGL